MSTRLLPPLERAARSTGRINDLEEAFLTWLGTYDKPALLHLDGPDAPPTHLSEMLDALRDSSRRLPAAEAGELGLPPGTWLGAAASQLQHAVHDPRGPRCRSYRAAAYYLRSYHGLEGVFDGC